MLLPTICLLCLGSVFSQLDVVDISFTDKTIRCELSDESAPPIRYGSNDCTIFIYVNNVNVAYARARILEHVYKKLLRATIRCDAVCQTDIHKNANLKSEEIVVNGDIFMLLCGAGAGVFILIVGLVIFGVCYRRRHYKRLADEEDLKPREMEPVPEKPAQDLYSLPDKKKKKGALDLELEAELKKKRVSSSSSSEDNLADPDTPAYLYDTGYNPDRYNYAEITSEI